MILRNSTSNRFLRPTAPASTAPLVRFTGGYQDTNYTRYGPPIRPAQPQMRANQVSDYMTPEEFKFHQAWTLGQGPAANRFAQRYMTGAAFSGGLAGAGELIGQAVGQTVLNRAFDVASGGGRFASQAMEVARRMALGPREFMAGVLGNVGHLAGTGLALSQTGTAETQQPTKVVKPINTKQVLQPIIKKYMDRSRRTRTPAAGRSRAE